MLCFLPARWPVSVLLSSSSPVQSDERGARNVYQQNASRRNRSLCMLIPLCLNAYLGHVGVYAFGRGNNIPRCYGLSVPRHVVLVYSGVKKERRKLYGKKQYRVLSTKQEHKLRFVQWHNFFILSWRANEQELSELFVGLVFEGVKASVFVPMILGIK